MVRRVGRCGHRPLQARCAKYGGPQCGPHRAVARWGKEERTPRLSRHAYVAARLSVFCDDAGGPSIELSGIFR